MNQFLVIVSFIIEMSW